MKKPVVLGVVLMGAAACQDATSPRPDATTLPAALPGINAAAAAALADDYIVVLRSDESDPDGQARGLVAAHGGSLKHVYRAALKGFAVADLPDAAVEALRRNPNVVAIERDAIMTADGVQSGVQSWGLDRIDATNGELDRDGSYEYPNGGAGVTAYIIDTGINSGHGDFTGRVGTGRDFIDGDTNPEDCHGHGTHVAGTVGGTEYGVAKSVTLVAVRVLNCAGSGTTSGVIAGVDWVRGNAAGKLAVANMSLGGGASSTLNSAVTNAVNAGVVFAVAAGNSNADACFSSPAGAAAAITVGATTSSDAKASYSNWGTCVDLNAPGSSITSDWLNGGTNTISGTSMASPHVAGAAALYRAANPGAPASAVASAIVDNATPNTLSGLVNDTPNLLLYVGFIGGGTTPPPDNNPPPSGATVSITEAACSDFSCTFTATTSGSGTLSWDFGDGGTSSANPATHLYTQKGGYTVTASFGDAVATKSVSCTPKRGCKSG